ncbi:MAG: hypothetical protein ACTH5B_15095 [Marinomonas sp.]|uniref:hypothetical protein n=1 Tax=Marinomonas sp. TaxID=1904862 RepID=UPI003F96336C
MPRADIRPLMTPHRRALLPQPLFNHRPSWREAESHTLIEHRVVPAREHGATACCVWYGQTALCLTLPVP